MRVKFSVFNLAVAIATDKSVPGTSHEHAIATGRWCYQSQNRYCHRSVALLVTEPLLPPYAYHFVIVHPTHLGSHAL